MAGAYDDRDGWIWLDGAFVPWREANVHILTHALHYASSVFEGERCYNGEIFKSREHGERPRYVAREGTPDRQRKHHKTGAHQDRRLLIGHLAIIER